MRRLAMINYSFEKEIYENYASLAAAFCRDPLRASYEISRGDFIKHFERDQLVYHELKNVLNRFKDDEVRLAAVIRVLDPTAGIYMDGHMFFNVNDIATFLHSYYPKYLDHLRKYFKEGLVSYIFYNNMIVNVESKIAKEIALIKIIEKFFEVDFIYYYFIEVFRLNINEQGLPMVKTKEAIISEIENRVYKVSDIALNNVYAIANDNEFLFSILQHIGFEQVCNFCLEMKKDFYYSFIELIERNFNVKFPNLLSEGYHMWLVKNYQYYSFHSKEAKKIRAKLIKYNRLITSNALSQDEFTDIASRALKVYKEFNNLFARNLLIGTKESHISAIDFKYYLSIKVNDVHVPQVYYEKNYTTLDAGELMHMAIEEGKEQMELDIANHIEKYEKVLKESHKNFDILSGIKKTHKKSTNLLGFNVFVSVMLGIVALLFTDFLLYNQVEENSFLIRLVIPIINIEFKVNLLIMTFGILTILFFITMFISIFSKAKYLKAINIYELFISNFEKLRIDYSTVLEYKYGKDKKSTNLWVGEENLRKEKEFKKLSDVSKQNRPLDSELMTYNKKDLIGEVKREYGRYLDYTREINETYKTSTKLFLVIFALVLVSMVAINFVVLLLMSQLSIRIPFIYDLFGEVMIGYLNYLLIFPITYMVLSFLFDKQSIKKEIFTIILGTIVLILFLYI